MRERINVYGTPSCKACRKSDDYFSSRDDIDYRFYNIDEPENAKMVNQVLPVFKEDPSTPVIQRCVVRQDGKIDCTVVQGFRREDYE